MIVSVTFYYTFYKKKKKIEGNYILTFTNIYNLQI